MVRFLRHPLALTFVLAGFLLAGCGDSGDAADTAGIPEPVTMTWDALIPEGYEFVDPLDGVDVSGYADDDPRAIELLEKLRTSWTDTPVVEALDGERIRIGGFIVPLEGDGTHVSEFLLVPYYGACIHVPPPPPNQVVHVTMVEPGLAAKLFDAVWLTGPLRAQRSSSELADAGYSMRPDRVEAF